MSKEDSDQIPTPDKSITETSDYNYKNRPPIGFGHLGELEPKFERNFIKRLVKKVLELKRLTLFELLSLSLTLLNLITILLLISQTELMRSQTQNMTMQTESMLTQTRQLSTTLELTAITNISNREFETNEILFEHPKMQPYFFLGVDISEQNKDYDRVSMLATLRVDFANTIYEQSEVITDLEGQQVLKRYIEFLFAKSPIMCKELNGNDQLYIRGFVQLARQGCSQKR